MLRALVIRSVFALTSCSALASCASSTETFSAPGSLPTPPAGSSAPVLLKDMVVSSLPSPYYHFEYDAAGQMTQASFASGLMTYALAYVSGRLDELRNNLVANNDRLLYTYDSAGRVGSVKYADASGEFSTIVFFGYTGHRLTTVERDRRVDGGWIIDKTMSFVYGADGNVSDVTEHHPAIADEQDETTVVDHYADYDSGVNVDGFDLLHSEFFDQLVILPQVQLQRSNARTVTRTGDGQTYRVQYAFTYDAHNRPVSKAGVITLMSGANAGQVVQTTTTFSYY